MGKREFSSNFSFGLGELRRLIFIKRVLYFQYFAINFQFADKLDNNLTPAPLVASFKINWLPLNKDVERVLMRFLHEYTCLVT